jgi:hypothetical protein
MHRFQMTCASVVLLIMPILSAQSDEYPILNVLPVCRGIASQGDASLEAGDRSVSIQECVKAEQADRESMIKEWSTFSASDKKHCLAEATMGGESSYTELITCLEMARDVKNLKQSPESSKKTH